MSRSLSPGTAAVLALAFASAAPAQPARHLEQVYTNNDFQLTGVTISKSGRLFVNFPRWSDRYQYAVVEVMKDGSTKPFPDENWNIWDMKPATAGKHFVCVQSVVVDENDNLWILDPAAPFLAAVVPGGPKLVKVDLKTNQVTKVIPFGSDAAKTASYLNDIRFDLKRHTAYMTDSGMGGIVVTDIESGRSHRVLDGHPSVNADPSVKIVINNKPVVGPTGQPPQFNSDGIALSPDGQYLYYQALTGQTLYRVKTDALRGQGSVTPEKVADTFPVDGLWTDRQSNIYLSDLNHNSVKRLRPGGRIEDMVTDSRLQWPDTFTEDTQGNIYVTASHIHEGPTFNKGKSTRTQPYAVFRFHP